MDARRSLRRRCWREAFVLDQCECPGREYRAVDAPADLRHRLVLAARRLPRAVLVRCRLVPWRRARRHRGTGYRPHQWPSRWTDVDHGLCEVGVDFQSCNCVVKGDSGDAARCISGPASCFFESCRPVAVDGRPLDVIARHGFRACDKSVCDGKTRRALLWLSVPFERGNHTRSNGGALRRGSRGRG